MLQRFAKITLCCFLALFLVSCASGTKRVAGTKYPQYGIASWYGEQYNGRQTASGERFNMNAMTAAHRTLPFGSRVRVTNLENGRTEKLRINDRGPFIRGRVIDVSYRAAQRLGFTRQGLTKVRIDLDKLPG
ncbi:MAG TPA: septal ring lytic transglycosylase RlpA family protein [bacterium]|nr:septal ring lytic transglycosylase RlpA family protein [bacterium]HQO35054.1 septal ring lytic transglycosylase RlpA family protein [bacterium]